MSDKCDGCGVPHFLMHLPGCPKLELPNGPPKEIPVTDTPRMTQDPAERKRIPIVTGCLDYFPDALAEVARLSMVANEKHNPGQPMHWSRGKSNDHADTLARHLSERGTIDPSDGFLHDIKVAWRALALAQEALEKLRGLPPARGSVKPVFPPAEPFVQAD